MVEPATGEVLAEIDTASPADIFRLAAEEIKRLETHVLPSVDPRKRVFTHRKPNGVYGLITPWNFPMNIPAELLAAALAAGNPAVIKPSENAPLSALALAAADAAVFGAHFVSGQCCVATERLLVHDSVHDELVDLVMDRAAAVTLGDPLDGRAAQRHGADQ